MSDGPEQPSVTIANDQLLKILDQWEKLYAKRSPMTVIIQDGDNYELEARNTREIPAKESE